MSAGLLLNQARLSQGLGLRQLALETRISTPVLEALERGWRDRLPEAAYLRTMLPLLEHRLNLSPGSLDGALPAGRANSLPGHRPDPLLLRFTPGSIDVFTTWQGTLLYGLLTLGLIYALNLQQQQLSRQGLLSSTPIPPLDARSDSQPRRQESRLLSAYPDLTPLKRAEQGQALRRLRSESQVPQDDFALGELSLQLSAPSRVEIRSERGGIAVLSQVSGSLSLPVLPPFRLRLEPAPTDGTSVRWNGRPL
ncbi:MAG: helix-turn-helix transcriptional regulator, partial [Cyanobium sp.]